MMLTPVVVTEAWSQAAAPQVTSGSRRIVSRSHPGFSTGESVFYLPSASVDQGGGAPAFAPSAVAAIKEQNAARITGNKRLLISSETIRKTKPQASEDSLLVLRNYSATNWNTVERFGPLDVNGHESIALSLVLSGHARILVEQYDAEGGPLGSRLIKNRDDKRKLLTFGFMPDSDAASIVLALYAPPQSSVEVEDVEILAIER